MSIYEYDEEGHLEIVKEEGRQLGIAEGEKLGIIKGEEKERSNGIKVFIVLYCFSIIICFCSVSCLH